MSEAQPPEAPVDAAAELTRFALEVRRAAHQLNNALSLPVGVIELIQAQSGLRPRLAELAVEAGRALGEATALIDQLQRRARELAPPGTPEPEA
jgi:hypothetical protein